MNVDALSRNLKLFELNNRVSHSATHSIPLHFINKAPGHKSHRDRRLIGRQAGDTHCLCRYTSYWKAEEKHLHRAVRFDGPCSPGCWKPKRNESRWTSRGTRLPSPSAEQELSKHISHWRFTKAEITFKICSCRLKKVPSEEFGGSRK